MSNWLKNIKQTIQKHSKLSDSEVLPLEEERDDSELETPFKEERRFVLKMETQFDDKAKMKDLSFYLYEEGEPPEYCGWIWFKVHSDCHSEKMNCLCIQEFLIKGDSVNQGCGSLLLAESLHYIIKSFGKSTKIKGWLSPVDERDEKNRQRRNRVYEKLDFKLQDGYATLEKIDLDLIQRERTKHNSRKAEFSTSRIKYG